MKGSDVAANLSVDSATVCRIVKRFRETGTVSKTNHPARRVYRKLIVGAEMFFTHIVLCRPGIYFYEIARALYEDLGVDVTLSSICMFLKNGFTRQRLKITALQRDPSLRMQFI